MKHIVDITLCLQYTAHSGYFPSLALSKIWLESHLHSIAT